MIAEVALRIPFQTPYDYSIPKDLQPLLQVGCRVLVPLKSKTAIGVVVSLKQQSKVLKLKDILQSLDPVPIFNPAHFSFMGWISRHYLVSLGEVFHASLPSGLNKHFETVLTLNPELPTPENFPLQKTAIDWFADQRFQTWLQQGILIWDLKRQRKSPKIKLQPEPTKKTSAITLNTEQSRALKPIIQTIAAKKFICFLLHGVAGSGKTEVYLQASGQVLKQGKTVLVLVPEIALTMQTVERFEQRFGPQVILLHSKLTPSQRLKNWWQIKKKPCSIVIGTRSAVLAPFSNLGLVVVDEEHDPSYKQQDSPCYNARDAAIKLASLNSATIILGSATPSIETYYNAKNQKYQHLKLEHQVWNNKDLAFKLVNLKEQSRVQGVFYLSQSLYHAMRETYQKKQQCIVFLNRRGFAAYLKCQNCDLPHFCKNCSIPMTWHQAKKKLVCHYCLLQTQKPQSCAQCQGVLRQEGMGTERVEQDLKALFKTARVMRFDTDTLKNPKILRQSLKLIFENQVDFIVGTQLISKGHDFPNIGLVCILLADMSLSIPDLRAAERTYQLVTQVAGRAGRSQEMSAEVWLQTYNPEHAAFNYQKNDEHFYATELEKRQILREPPFVKSMLVQISHPKDEICEKIAKNMALTAKQLLTPNMQMLGPVTAWLHKRSNRFYWQLLFKCSTHQPLQSLGKKLLWGTNQFSLPKNARVNINIDP